MSERGDIRRLDVTATFACVGALSFWSLGPIFVTYLTGYLDSWTQNLLRYSVACLFWLPFLLFSIRKRQFDTGTWRRAIVPALANVIMQSLYAAAFYYIGPAFMVLLAKSSIIWVAGFSLIFFADERALARSKRFWLGLALSMLGAVGVLCFKKDFAAAGTLTGVVITLAQAFMWAVYTVSVRIAFRDTDSRSGFSVISIYTVAGLCVFAMLFGRVGDFVRLGVGQWAAVVISGVLCIAVAHVLYYAAMRRIGATIPALVVLAQPFIVLAISYIVFGESLNGFQLFFGLVLLTGSALAIWAQQQLAWGERLVTRGLSSVDE
ncbi:MAG: DMT family transporter [Planctomycetota bacterium]|nr:DMT family transporter [Planctomycetota bacterium]